MQKKSSSKSKYKNASRFAFGFGIFLLIVAFITWFAAYKGVVYNPKDSSFVGAVIFQLAFKYFGVNGVIGLLIILGIVFIAWSIFRLRKSEQIEEN